MESSSIDPSICINMLKRFDREKSKEAITPMTTSCYLDLDEKGKHVDESRYRGMINSLLYLLVAPILYIVFVYVLDFKLILRNLI